MKTRYAVSLALLLWAAPRPAASATRWSAYKSTVLNLQVSVPSDWAPAKLPNALAFRYEDPGGATAAIGIMKSELQDMTIEQAADQEFEREGKPAEWLRSNARVGGMRAIKIVGNAPKSPDRKMVHYYIETPAGIYLIQCQATADRWSTFSPIFATILSKLTFF